MKVKNFFKGIIRHRKIVITVALVLVVAVAAVCVYPIVKKDEPKADTEYLNALLTKSSELTSAKLTITGVSDYEDTGITFINRSDFTMVYKATVRAGIDMEEVEISSDDINKIIYVTIPKAEIQDVKVDPSTIRYYDEKFSLFNTDEKEDSNKAQTLAEESAKEEAVSTGILELADNQSETLIKEILANAIPDGYEIKVKK